MNKFKLIFCFLFTVVLFFSYTKASNMVDFNNFANDIKIVKESKRDISIVKFFSDFNRIKTNKCDIKYFDTYAEVSPVCLLDDTNIFTLSPQKSLDFLLDDLAWFGNYYSLSDSFSYAPTHPYFSYSIFTEYNNYKSSIYKKIVITYLTNKNQYIKIDNSILAKFIFKKYSFYVVPTDLSTRSACSLANYRAAVSHLEWLKLLPGQELNLNDLISYDSNSCKWTTTKSYMFYAGACGSSTQLFRLSLLMPYLDVIERHPHTKWWAFYYGNKVSWDDAAMYENSKKMIIKNNFDTSIYFKVYEQWAKSYLVWVVPNKIYERVEINKTNQWLSASVSKNVYNSMNELVNIYQFDSRYFTYNPYRS